jgi:hypothetical protein
MNRARGWLNHDGFSRRKLVDGENSSGLDAKKLGKPAVLRDAVRLQVEAKQVVTAQAVETVAARFVAVRNDPLAFFQASDGATESKDFAGELVSGYERKAWGEFALMNMEIGPA